MDPLVKAMLERLGMRLPDPGPAPSALEQAVQDKAALKAQENLKGWQKQSIHAMDAAGDFVRGLNYFPTDEIPKDSGPAYGGGAMLAAALPLFGAKGIPGMYSRVEKVAEAIPESINANKLWSILKNRTAKEELDWRKVPQIIQEGPEVKKEALVSHLQKHPLDVKVIRHGGVDESWKDPKDEYNALVKELDAKHGENWSSDDLPTDVQTRLRKLWDESQTPWKRQPPENPRAQYEDYAIPGGKRYREDLITLPEHNIKKEWEHQVKLPDGEVAKVVGGSDYGRQYAERFNGTVLDSRLVPQPAHLQTEAFHGHHWEEPNVLVHVRHNERNLPNPEPEKAWTVHKPQDPTAMYQATRYGVLGPTAETPEKAIKAGEQYSPSGPTGRMIENIQSDWHQKGAHEGYSKEGGELGAAPQEMYDRLDAIRTERDQLSKEIAKRLGQPIEAFQNPAGEIVHEDVSQAAYRRLGELSSTPGAKDAITAHNELQQPYLALRDARVAHDNLMDAIIKAQKGAVPDAPFKDSWAELGLKQQLLDIAHNNPDTKWLGIAPSSELRSRGEVISPEFQDKQLPNTLEKLLKPFGGRLETGQFNVPIDSRDMPSFEFEPEHEVIRRRVRGIPEAVASLWPPTARRAQELAEAGHRAPSLADLVGSIEGAGRSTRGRELGRIIQDQEPTEREIKFPMAKLTPDMLAQIKKKGFPLLLALLAQRMRPTASHESK